MFQFTLKMKDSCLCGSGKKYKNCCFKFIELTIDDYYSEIDKCNYKLAYNAINSVLTKYLIHVKRHTAPLLKQSNIINTSLLEIDIEAISEILNHILFILSKDNINVDFTSKINFIKSILDMKLWNERMESFILTYHYIINFNQEKLNTSVSNIKIDELKDIELIKLILDIKSEDLGIWKRLILIEKIISTEKNNLVKLKYQFEKSLIYFFNNDKESSFKIAKEVIENLESLKIESTYDLHVASQIFSLFAQMFSQKSYYKNAIDLYSKLSKDENLTTTAKAENLVFMGYAYYLIQEYPSATKCFIESKNYKYLPLSDIYLSFVKIATEDYSSAEKIINSIVYDDLSYDKFDYLLASSLYILQTKDIKNIDFISFALKDMKFDNLRYFDTLKLTLLMELKELSFTPHIIDEKIRLNWLDKINKFITLQPNIFGFGININNIIDEFNKK